VGINPGAGGVLQALEAKLGDHEAGSEG
jgi:hypothetical protein